MSENLILDRVHHSNRVLFQSSKAKLKIGQLSAKNMYKKTDWYTHLPMLVSYKKVLKFKE